VNLRSLLRYRISITQAILALGVFVAFLSLVADGDLVAGLGVVAVAVVAWSILVLVQRRRLPARTGRWEETAVFPCTCEVVWRLIKPADTAPLLQPSFRRGYQVPGTPDGLGEQQAFESHDGTTFIIEVIEFEPNRRAVTRQVSPTPVETLRSIQTVEPVDGGCKYTEAIEADLQPGHRMLPKSEQSWRSEARDRVHRIRAILDSPAPGVPPTGLPPRRPIDRSGTTARRGGM
jgi:hypothetical protein